MPVTGAPNTITPTARRGRRRTAAEQFPADVRDLLSWVSGQPLVEGHPFGDIRAQPAGPTVPEAWILGSSDYGAQVAAYFGLPFCFAHFITDGHGADQALAVYREGYRPSARHPEPHAALCVWAMAAETEEEAAYQFRPREIWRLNRDRGVYAALVSPEEAAARAYSGAEAEKIARIRARALYGSAEGVAAKLHALAATHGVEEIAILTTLHDKQVRQRSYTLLAQALAG
jgi:luciferase family oxidoreductase group 1